jgi:ADP-heptose:LPS heptosyltransferase
MSEGIFRQLRRGVEARLHGCRRFYQAWVVGPGASRSGLLGQKLRWPLPWSAPPHRNVVAVARRGGLGDVLMCTPALRQLKRLNPSCRVVFFTRHRERELLEGLPFIDEFRDHPDRPPEGAIVMRYEFSVPSRRHIAQLMGDCIGVRVSDVRPSCPVEPDLVARYRREWAGLPRPTVLINRHASGWTPNMTWPEHYWDELTDQLSRRATVIQIGVGEGKLHRGVAVDLRGTGIRELVASIAAGDLHVGPVSGPTHIAAAVGTPAVAIFGGYQHPCNTGYRGHINLYSPVVPCAPCWLNTECPHQRVCLSRITPAAVERWVWRRWESAGRRGQAQPALA